MQVVLVLDLEPDQLLLAWSRGREEHAPAVLGPPLRLLDEEQPRRAQKRELFTEMGLEPW